MVGDRKSIKTSIGRHGSRTIENQHWSLMDFISTYTSSSPATLQIPTAGIAFSLLTSFTREVLDYKMLIQRYFTLSEVPIDRLKHLLAEESVSLCGSYMAAGGVHSSIRRKIVTPTRTIGDVQICVSMVRPLFFIIKAERLLAKV